MPPTIRRNNTLSVKLKRCRLATGLLLALRYRKERMISVIKEACSLTKDRATVVLESESIAELTSPAARAAALKQATALGFQVHGYSGSSGPYVVDKDGNMPFRNNSEINNDDLLAVAKSGSFKFRHDFYMTPSSAMP